MAAFIGVVVAMVMVSLLTSHSTASSCSEPRSMKYNCPKYEKDENSPEAYEVRVYEASTWVMTNMSSQAGGGSAFMRLFRYIRGENNDKIKIDMTVPVIKQHDIEGDVVKPRANATMFYLPDEQPPQPTEAGVELIQLDQVTVYVRSYGGYSYPAKVNENFQALLEALPDDVDVSHARLFVAGYDAPWKVFNRHNEIWLIDYAHGF